MGLEPLYMPCSGMKCGDIIYRSTLDPSLRLEERGLNPALLGLGGFSLAYLFTQPGIFPGFIDYYFLAPLFSAFRKKLDRLRLLARKQARLKTEILSDQKG